MSLQITIPDDQLTAILRERIDLALNVEDVRQKRREMIMALATITSEEGSILLSVTPRHFRELCERIGVPVVNLGHKTPRYQIAAVLLKLDELSIAARKDKEQVRAEVTNICSRLLKEVDALAA